MSDAGGSVSKFVGVLAGSPAALRAFARMRHELRGGALPRPTARADRAGRRRAAAATPTRSPSTLARRRAAGLGLDEISRARSWGSNDPREAALLAFLQALVRRRGPARPAPPRGGARGGLDRRAAARGGRARRAERVPEPDVERRSAAPGPDGPDDPAPRRLRRSALLLDRGGADPSLPVKWSALAARLGEVPANAVRVRAAVDHAGPDVVASVLESDLRPAGQGAVRDADRAAMEG